MKYLFCDNVSPWSSWVRVRGHLSGDGSLALAVGTVSCTQVPQGVARTFEDMIVASLEQKRQRAAEARGRAVDATVGFSSGGGGGGGATMKWQKSIEAAFDTSHRAEMDEAIASFFFGCDIPFQVVGSPLFKKMIDVAKGTGPS